MAAAAVGAAEWPNPELAVDQDVKGVSHFGLSFSILRQIKPLSPEDELEMSRRRGREELKEGLQEGARQCSFC